MSRAKWATVSSEDISDLTALAGSIIDSSYSLMRGRAQGLGPVSSPVYLEWVTLREGETTKQAEGFLATLSVATKEHQNWASMLLSPAPNLNVFSDSIDSGETAMAYTRRWVTGLTDAHARQMDALIAADTPPENVSGSFTLDQWASTALMRELEWQIQGYLSYIDPFESEEHGWEYAQHSIITPAIDAAKEFIRERYGQTFFPTGDTSGYELMMMQVETFLHGAPLAWTTEALFSYDTGLLARMMQRASDIRDGEDAVDPFFEPGLYTMADYKQAVDAVERAPRLYLREDAIEIYKMNISPAQAQHYITVLDHLNAVIPIHLREEFEFTYKQLWTYVRVTNTEYYPWQIRADYIPEVAYAVRLYEDLDTLFEAEWTAMVQRGAYGTGTAMSGEELRSVARTKGLDAELNIKLAQHKVVIEGELARIKKNVWYGPTMPNADGLIIPLDGFHEAEELYSFWIRGRIYEEFTEIENWLREAEADSNLSFIMTRDIAEMELRARRPSFLGADMGRPATRSVMNEKWDIFRGVVYGTIGMDAYTQIQLMELFDAEQIALLAQGNMESGALMDGTARTMPEFYAEAYQLYRNDAIRYLTDAEVDNYHRKLLDERYLVPVREKTKYEFLIAQFRGSLEKYRGGVQGMITVEDDEAFVMRHKERLRTGPLADWFAMDLVIYGQPFQAQVWLDKRMDELRSDVRQIDARAELLQVGEDRIVALQRAENFLREIERGLVTEARLKIERMIAELPEWRVDHGETLIKDAQRFSGIEHPDLSVDVELLKEALAAIGNTLVERDWESDASRVIKQLNEARLGPYPLSMDVERYVQELLNDPIAVRYPAAVDRIRELLRDVHFSNDGQPLSSGLPPFVHFAPLKSREDATTTSVEELIEFAREMLTIGVFVEPKINGQRACLQTRNGEVRIFLEGDHQNWIEAFHEIGNEASMMSNIILDGELVDRIGGRIAPDIGTGEFTRGEIDAGEPIFLAFDILHYDGEDMMRYPYEQRRRRLEEIVGGAGMDHVQVLPAWFIDSEDQLREMIQLALEGGGSEGALIKSSQGKYLLGATAPDWMKWRRTKEIDVVVLGQEIDEADNLHYRCGLEYMGEVGFSQDKLEKIGDKLYVPVGTTFSTRVKVKDGDVVRVRVSKINKLPKVDGMEVEWVDPTVVSRQEGGEPDSVGAALNISRILSASISKPYSKISDLSTLVDEALSKSALFALDKQTFDIFAQLAFPRLRRMTWALLEKISARMAAFDAGIGLESRGDVAFITAKVVKAAKADWDLIESSRTDSPEASLIAAQRHMDIITAYIGMSDNDWFTTQLETLKKRIVAYIEFTGGARGLERVTIQSDLMKLRQRATDAMNLDPTDPERNAEAIRIRQELAVFLERIGRIAEDYSDEIKNLYEDLDRIPDPAELEGRYSNKKIQEKLDYWSERFADLDQMLNLNNPAKINAAMIEINAILNVLMAFEETDLTEMQMKFFGVQIQWRIRLFRGLYNQWRIFKTQTVAGADTTEVTQSRSIWTLLNSIVEDRLYGRGSLDLVLWERSKVDREMYQLMADRAAAMYSLDHAVVARMDEILQAAETVDGARTTIEAEMEPYFRNVDMKINGRYKELFSFRSVIDDETGVITNPQPLRTERDEIFWVSLYEIRKIAIPHDIDELEQEYGENARDFYAYAHAELDAGNSLMVKGRPGTYRVLARRGPDGELLDGDPSRGEELRLERMIRGVREEAMSQPLGQLDMGGGVSGLDQFIGGLTRALRGSVEVISSSGIGNGYYGGDVSGVPFFVTNMHLAGEGRLSVRLSDGREIPVKIRWQGSDDPEVKYFDVAILEALRPVEINAEPLALGSYSAEGASNVYGTAVSPALGEADIVRLTQDKGLDPYFNKSLDIERVTIGFSGAPIVDEYGNVVALHSAGAEEEWSKRHPGLKVNSYGGVIPLQLLQTAYRQAGLTYLGGAALGRPWNNRKAEYTLEALMNSVPPAVRHWAKKKARAEGRPVRKEDLKLRYKDPGGKENVKGVRAALRRLGQTKLPRDVLAKTKAFLQRKLKKLGAAEPGGSEFAEEVDVGTVGGRISPIFDRRDGKTPEEVVEAFGRDYIQAWYGDKAMPWFEQNKQRLLHEASVESYPEEQWLARIEHELGGEIIVDSFKKWVSEETGPGMPYTFSNPLRDDARQVLDHFGPALLRADTDESRAEWRRLNDMLKDSREVFVTPEIIEELRPQLVAIANQQISNTAYFLEEFGITDMEYELFKEYFGYKSANVGPIDEARVRELSQFDAEHPEWLGDVDASRFGVAGTDVNPVAIFANDDTLKARYGDNAVGLGQRALFGQPASMDNYVAIVDSRTGETLEGDVNVGKNNFIVRAMDSLQDQVEWKGATEKTRENAEDVIRRQAGNLITVGTAGCGGTYLGRGTDGRHIFITAAHCVSGGDEQRLFTLDGKEIVGQRIFVNRRDIESRNTQKVYGRGLDLAFFAALPEEDKWIDENLSPVVLATHPLEKGDLMLSLSSHHREVEMAPFDKAVPKRTRTSGYAGVYDIIERPEERARPGFSGSGVFNLQGLLVGIHSYGRGAPWGGHIGFETIKELLTILGIRNYGDQQQLDPGPEGKIHDPELAERAARYEPVGGAALNAGTLGNDAMFMAQPPSQIPVAGKVYKHTAGGDDTYTIQFDWNGNPQGFMLELESVPEKWTDYQDGKLGATINMVAPEGAEEVDTVLLLPSRMRTASAEGNRYYEFYLTFAADLAKNGLWGLSENAARDYPVPFFLFRLEDDQPFWLRDGHVDEKRTMPRWQRPTQAAVRKFAGRVK